MLTILTCLFDFQVDSLDKTVFKYLHIIGFVLLSLTILKKSENEDCFSYWITTLIP